MTGTYDYTNKPHGDYSYEFVGQVIRIRISGSWNREMMRIASLEFKDMVGKIDDNPWGTIFDVRDWELGTPEMIADISEVNAWSDDHGQVAEAVIYNDSLQKSIAEDSHQSFRKAKTGFFTTTREAFIWLQQEGLKIDRPARARILDSEDEKDRELDVS